MTNPARDPIPITQRATNPASVSRAVAVWGPYPAMRAGIRTLLAEVGVETIDAPPGDVTGSLPSVLIADAGDRPLAETAAELREQYPGAAIILLAGDPS